MPNIKIGDEVRVFDTNGSRMGQPDGGWHGVVVKIGRKYATIDYGRRTDQFELDGRRANDPRGARRFKTLDQVAEDERLRRAIETVEERGIELVRGHRLTLEQIEALAAFVRKL